MTSRQALRRALGYARISALGDDSTSIARQVRDIRALAESEGVELVEILVDEGISGRKRREKAERAVKMLADGEVDVLIAWRVDRFSRRGVGGIVSLLDALERPGAAFWTCDGRRSDSGEFRLSLVMLSEIARAEVESTVARTRSAIDYRRTVTHRFIGGASVPFGYTSVPAADGTGRILVLEPTEASLIREAAQHVLLDGWSPRRVAVDLNGRDVPTSKSPLRRAIRRGEPVDGLASGNWTTSTIRSLLTSTTLLGRQTHHGDVVRDEAGLPVEMWPPVVSLSQHQALVLALSGPGRSKLNARAPRVLSGVAYCDICNSRLYVTTSGGRTIYACKTSWNSADAKTCPSPKIDAGRLETYVVDAALTRAGARRETRAEITSADPTAAAQLAEVEAALAEAGLAVTRRGADIAALAARLAEQSELREDLIARAGDVREVLRSTGRTLAEAYAADDDVEARRSILLGAIEYVSVLPAPYPSAPPSERVRLHWLPELEHVERDEGESLGPRKGAAGRQPRPQHAS